MTEDWAERTLCPDGGCTGVIGNDGACRVCGRAAPFWGDERRRGMVVDDDDDHEPADLDPAGGAADVDDDRELCPDGACTGLIGPAGTCSVCGRPGPERAAGAGAPVTRVVPPSVAASAAGAARDDDSDDRRLCPDGACVGLLDAGGVCTTCGKSDEGN